MGKRREKLRKRLRDTIEAASTDGPKEGNNEKTSGETGTNAGPFSHAELGICLRVVQHFAQDPSSSHPFLRELRKALDPLVQHQVEKYREGEPEPGSGPARKRQKTGEDADARLINSTKLRAERMKHLERLNEEGKEEVLRVLDGVGVDHSPDVLLLGSGDQLQLPAGEQNPDPTSQAAAGDQDAPPQKVETAISCYICKSKFHQLHFYYDQLCPDCAALNYRKRTETVDMRGKVCFVTGARVKIGYRCALKLLRCGATVIATTRFPADAARRFTQEKDFATWSNQLHVYGLDFRHVAAVEQFCEFIKQKYSRLDVIINNACQTIRRPPAFYQHLLSNERANGDASAVPESFLPLLQSNFEFHHQQDSARLTASAPEEESNVSIEEILEEDLAASSTPATSSGMEEEKKKEKKKAAPLASRPASSGSAPATVTMSAEMSQIELLPEDRNYDTALFPTQQTDVNEQQVDLRRKNSWMLKLDEVSTPELAEVMLINAMAPAIINARLKSLMEVDPEAPKFIVNVSAMEGKFYRYKSDTHPHTNMAKAALNMMTRTSAQDYKKKNIYMTAVDTGWINDEKPLEKAVKHMKKHNFQTPLDEIDAAARVLDPVIAPLLDLAQGRPFKPDWGIFLKDYMKCEW